MRDLLIIRDPETMRALADARRLALVRLLIEAPQTAEELGQRLGQPKSGLYYHLGELEKHGLIEVIETRQKRNFLEKTYQAVARFYRLDRELFAETTEGLEALERTVQSVLDATAADIERLLKTAKTPAGLIAHIAHGQRMMHLSPERYAEFRARLDALVADFQAERDEPGDAYGFTFLAYPLEAPSE